MIIVITTLMITKMLFSRNAKDFRGGKRNLQNLNSVQKKCQPSVFTPEVQLEDWHCVDHDCFDVPAFKRKIERLQKLCRGLRPIFASSSDRTLGWIRTHSRGDQTPTNRPSECANPVQRSRILKRAKNLHSCDVYALHHSTVQSCLFNLGHSGTDEARKTFRGLKITTIPLSADVTCHHPAHRCLSCVLGKLLCFVLLHTAAAMLFRLQTHNVVVARLATHTGWAWQPLVPERFTEKYTETKKISVSLFYVQFWSVALWREVYFHTNSCFCIGCVISDIGPSLLFRPIL